MLRAVVLVVTVSLTLVLLPIAINVGTGGTAPVFLAPYVGWTWPVIGVLWLIAIGAGLSEVRSHRRPVISSRSADQPRNRPNALTRVDAYLNQRVAASLAARTRVALALDRRPEEVVRPYDLTVQPIDSAPRELPDDADIAAVFDSLQEAMLILGAPGAGKTTLLTRLARTLTARAQGDESQPIPVLLDLSGWGGTVSRHPDDHPRDSPMLAGFVHWLLAELDARYGIPPAVGRIWLLRGDLALLFDGLDEIDANHREKFAGVLHDLRVNYRVVQLAVTCRTHDYDQLANKLTLNGAVHIRPLSRQQVLDYFAAVGPELDGARAAIEQDEELWDLVTSPLMLNVLLLAYQDRAPEDLAGTDVRRDLFDTFIVEVLARRRPNSRQYDARTVVRALRTLASRTAGRRGSQVVVPRWPNTDGRDGLLQPDVVYLLHAVCLPALLSGLVAGATVVLAATYGVLTGLAVAVPAVLVACRWPFAGGVMARLDWRQLLALVLCAVAGTAASVVLFTAAMGLIEILPNAVGLATGVEIGLLVGWCIRVLTRLPTFWQAVAGTGSRWRLAPWAGAGGVAGLLLAVLLGADFAATTPVVVPGLLLGFFAMSVMRRTSLRAGPVYRVLYDVLLCWTGYLPWRRGAFLRYAADRFVLARTAPGEYAFIHLLVRDYLAESDPEDLAAKITRRQVR
ncbi:NACHT domain-containing protein [Kribbella sandramycini]|uniref:NACHT domain-containing protein n=1 Tax=Kribbella sandramycini TaxID=60450 RepID=A0A7Y4P195_9ACTN|nr:NACHT domain-containing protein [Kribbella sandramycini]